MASFSSFDTPTTTDEQTTTSSIYKVPEIATNENDGKFSYVCAMYANYFNLCSFPTDLWH